MKKFVSSSCLLLAALSSTASQTTADPIDVDQVLAQTIELIQNNENRAALDNLNWLTRHGVSYNPSFHDTLVTTVQALWLSFARNYAPAWKSYISVYNNAHKALLSAPQNCAAFDVALSYSQHTPNATTHMSFLENTEQSFPTTWQRCWSLSSSFTAIEFISEPLITQYVGDLSDHFKLHIVDTLNATYRDCDSLPSENLTLECKDKHKQKLIDASVMYQDAAMAIHDDISEAGSIGAHTIILFLEWQTYDNQN
ncbi:hypothetical protein N473_03950 [Pseudoalteromonas luteoviolacea CPMOR-1]|uniref:Imelysin-like domain-containing protein n=1 Tax=Pseudoalteromonas luteoviolacea CPMOR-1 TaxID=1365248 RepID=A0A167IG90_9GAMM|nr:hypothetical protein [Pseudoalteromonas luteoviolacea]KZN59323.1 hypothetical protein N473_03950 [Pseudoalteromonas luteoviolacea CPMOR-1]